MKSILVLLVLLTGIVFNTCFAQTTDSLTLSKKNILIFRLANGAEKLTRDGIFLTEQEKSFKQIPYPIFRKNYPKVNAGGAFVFEFKPSVTRILSLKDIFREFNIAVDDQALPVQIIWSGKSWNVFDKASICATENSIKSVKIDREKGVIIITSY